MTSDIFRPFDDLLEDKKFWTEFEVSLVHNIVPKFLEIFVAGAVAGTKVKEKAYPSELPDSLSADEIADLAEQAIMDYVPEFTRGISATTYDQVRSSVARARETGLGVEQVLREIAPLFSKSRAESIAVTETTRLFGIGAQASYKLQGFNAWRWMSVNDPWVDPVCAGLSADSEAKPFPMDKIFEPAHPRCRCFPSPVHVDTAKPVIPEPSQGTRPGTPFPAKGFKTRADMEAWTRERFPNLENVDFTGIRINTDFTGAYVSNLNPTLREFDRLTDIYPKVTERLRTLTTRPAQLGLARFSKGTLAYATTDGKTIALNPKFYGDPAFKDLVYNMTVPRKGTRFDPEAGGLVESDTVQWHPKGTGVTSSIFVHEYGHQVSNWLRTHPDPSVQNLWSGLIRNHLRRDDVATLSGYATHSPGEAFAEAFAQMSLGLRDNWHPSTKMLSETLTSIMEREQR